MRHFPLITLILLAMMLGLASFKAFQPTAGQIRFRVVGDTAFVNGHTNGKTFLAIANLKREHPQVRRLVLQYMSGTLDSMSNLKLARQIRAQGYATHLPARARIASGAVDLFLAGTQRTMDCGALIGVHAWGSSDGRTAQDPGRDVFEPVHRAFLSEMGITPDFYSFTRAAAPHHDVHWMSYDEIKHFDLLTDNPDCGDTR